MSKFIKLNLAWKSIKWLNVKSRLRRIQRRIYKAKRNGNIDQVRWRQKRLINSFDAKLLAVQLVTSLNRGKKTAGVDRVRGLTDKQKMALVHSLRLDGKASSIRRVWIPKPGKTELRPLGIPTIKDRAKQALAKFSLEPEWEAVFEPNSYGFIPARSTHDAIEAIFLGLRNATPKWVYDADLRKSFDRIDHDALLTKLNTFPEIEKQIRAWLKADIMEGYANNPKEITTSSRGTPQGGIISRLLANIALHGMENHLKNFVTSLPTPRRGANRGKIAKQKTLTIVRYADDFVLIHENLEILNACIMETKKWVNGIGLEINEEKSAIRDGRTGFNFLGFQIIQVKKNKVYKVKIYPHKDKQKSLLNKVKTVIQLNKANSAYKLIKTLRPIIIGWANYYRFCECKDTFHRLTDSIFRCVRAWVFRRDTRNGRRVVKEKYFPSGKTYVFKGVEHKYNWILFGKQRGPKGEIQENFLPHIVWVQSEKFVKVQGDASPFNGNYIYWGKRLGKFELLSARKQKLLKAQEMRCTMCKQPFVYFDHIEVDHIIPIHKGGKDTYGNLQLLHRHCHIRKTADDLRKP